MVKSLAMCNFYSVKYNLVLAKLFSFDFGQVCKDFCLKRYVYCFLGGLKGRKKLKATVCVSEIVLRVNLVILQSGFDWLWGWIEV